MAAQFHESRPTRKGPALKAWEARFEAWRADELARVERQRATFAALVDGSEKNILLDTMLERAWALLDEGECEAADALLEFIPELEARALLDKFFWNEGDE